MTGRKRRQRSVGLDVSRNTLSDKALRNLWRDLPGAFYAFELGAKDKLRFSFVSDSAADIYGFKPAELCRNPHLIGDRIFADDLPVVAQLMQVSMTTMHSAPSRWRYRHPAKGLRWLESWHTPGLTAKGLTRWHGWTQDITDRRERDEQADKLPMAVESGDDPVYCCAPDGRILFANRAGRRYMRLPTQDFVLSDCYIQGLISAEWETLLQRTMREGAAFFKAQHIDAAGDTLQVEGWASRGMLEGRDALWVFVHDVTENSRTEDRLRLYAALFECSHAGIIIRDKDSRIIDVNPAFLRTSGYSREELIGLGAGALVPPQRAPDTNEMIERLYSEGAWHGEFERVCKDASISPVLVTISLVRDAGGEVRNILSVASDTSELKAQQQRLEQLAHFDALTALPNRVLFAERLQQALAHSRMSGTQLAVCYLDLDGFKPINDHYGHSVGDALLVEIAKRLHASVRATDTVARIGGDEFALLITDIHDPDFGVHMLRELLAEISRPTQIVDRCFVVSASIGATFFPGDDADADTLLRHADEAMYQAKRSGRGCYAVFDTALERRLVTRRQLREEFEAALSRRELCLFYEPKIDLRRNTVVGAEALARWRHPRRGLLESAEFLPAIEDTDLLEALGEWGTIELRRQLEIWEAQGLRLPISLNIAARQLRRSDFPARLEQLLGGFCTSRPGRIELELVATAQLGDIEAIAETIRACGELGVGFSLDDFGTGYSSLSWLRELPVDTIKIDRSFIGDRRLVGGLIGLAHSFGRQVLAEGIETAAHCHTLLELGCELGQGYFFSRSLPAEDWPGWIESFESGKQAGRVQAFPAAR